MEALEFQIRLNSFTGPFDLLLHLVRRNEVDIRDVPLAGIAGQFLEHLQVLRWLDFEMAGEFLVVAATLMELKSRMLLPRAEPAPEAEAAESGSSLVAQLVEYRRYRKAAGLLDVLSDRQTRHLPRPAAIPDGEPHSAGAAIQKVEIWDLLNVFGKLVRAASEKDESQTIVDDAPQSHYEGQILAILLAASPLPFPAIFVPPLTRLRLIGFLLALLELVKQQRIVVFFGEAGEISVAIAPEEVESKNRDNRV